MSDSKHREPDLESPFLNEEIVGHIPSAPVAEAFGDDEAGVNNGDEAFSEEEEDAETLGSEDEQEEPEDEVVEECEEEDESTDGKAGIEGESTDAEIDVDSLTERQVGAGSGAAAGVMVAPYGSYNLRSGGAAVRFWPMVPGSTVAGATAPAPPPPAVAPRFALVDVLIRPTEDPKVVTAIAAPNLLTQVTGPPPARTMPLVPDAAGVSQICFAVPVAAGTTHFDGTLRLEIRRGTAAPGAAINVELPLRVPAGALTANLAVFFIVHTGLNRRYAWTKLRAERSVAPNAPIANANVELNLLRDNSDRTFSKINRQIPLITAATGFAAFNGRDVLGVPIGWPLIYKAAAAGFAPRAHMLRLAAANISDNLTPFVAAPPLRMLSSTVSLVGRRIMLDAGHGAVYALARFRRSQEWYVAHRIVDRVAEVLRTRHSVNAADILLTRTAGFALIDPAHIAIDDAPERGNRRFAFDLANRQVRIADTALDLLHVSDLVLTQHHAVTGAPQPVVAADRTRLLTVNATTVTAIETRLNNQLAPGQPGSSGVDPLGCSDHPIRLHSRARGGRRRHRSSASDHDRGQVDARRRDDEQPDRPLGAVVAAERDRQRGPGSANRRPSLYGSRARGDAWGGSARLHAHENTLLSAPQRSARLGDRRNHGLESDSSRAVFQREQLRSLRIGARQRRRGKGRNGARVERDCRSERSSAGSDPSWQDRAQVSRPL